MKKRFLALLLSMAMVVTAFPVTAFAAESDNKADSQIAEVAEAAEETETGIDESAVLGTKALERAAIAVGTNVARQAKASAISANTPVTNVNNGSLATADAGTSWNTWNSPESYPLSVYLTWEKPQVLSSSRVMWWADNATVNATGNVTFPKSAIIEYYDHNTESWVQIKGMTNELDEQTDNVGVYWGTSTTPQPISNSATGYINAGNRYWNGVAFAEPVKTTQIRLTVNRNGRSANGIGIGEWEVYGEEMTAAWGEVLAASIEGAAITTKDQVLTYTGSSLPAGVAGVEYAWSVAEGSEGIIAIEGAANAATVQVKTLATGKATLNLAVAHGDTVRYASHEIQIDGITSLDTYKTDTAAGIAPILPKMVVANGITFDDPTPSLQGNNGVNFGEEFNSKLVPVTWEEVDPTLYAADKIGTTFTVKGEVVFGSDKLEATAEITVNEKMVAPVANSTVTFENVQLTDNFWLPKQRVNAVNSLNKGILEIEKASGGEPNFVNSIKKLNGEAYSGHQGFVFQDTDIYKSIEAISYTLSVINEETDPALVAQKEKLEAKLAYWISLIEQVQYADGYINTHFTLRAQSYSGGTAPGTHRWRAFANHEMYNLGHFYEAAVAYTRYREGIGSPDYSLYVVAKRSADQIVALFGPGGTRNEVPGHEEIELAMVKLAKLVEEYEGVGTGQKYLDTVQLLINRRGQSGRDSGYQGGAYSQDNGSIKNVTEAVGHAVRACYFYAGVTDMATLLPEGDADRAAYLKTMDTLWDSVALTKTYITGGIGVASHGEDFGNPYELPNNDSYCETCAAIALANWNQRMNLVHEDAKYADVVERTLYNAILVGTNLEGNLFYYSSRLEVSNGNGRSQWFACACCPPNLMRTIAKLSEYMYTVHADDLFINMYIGSNGNVNIDGTDVGLVQTTEYPWDGAIKLEVNPAEAKEFTMNIRIPGWVAEQYNKTVKITVNGERVIAAAENGYVAVTRTWEQGDVVMIDIPMEIRMTEAHPEVTTNQGKIALERGPIVYCMEKAGNAQINNNNNFNPLNFVIPRDADLTATYNPDLLNGVVEITGNVLYNNNGSLTDAKLQAVPYYAWNNRGDNGVQGQNSSSKMLIWTNAVGEPKLPDLPLVASYDMSVADGKLVDVTGNGNDAALKGFSDADITAENADAVLVFDGVDNYVELPAGIIKQEEFAIEATFKTSEVENSWLWALGTKTGKWPDVANYVFVSPRFDANGIRAGIKDDANERLFEGAGSIANDTYTTIRLNFDHGDMTLLVDGEEVSFMATGYSIQDILAKGTTGNVMGYIGKSTYDPDPYFTGTVTEFNIYASIPVDFSKLQAAVDAENEAALDQEDWSTESWKAYASALASAEEVLANAEASQSLVNTALENLLAAKEGLTERSKYTEGNIAPFATPTADYTNIYNTPETNMNNKELATGANTSWNCWGGATFPVGVYYTWDAPYVIESMRVIWWADGGGVMFPGSAKVQYKDENGAWVTITGMVNELGETTDQVGVRTQGGYNGGNQYWNEVTFAEPIKTTALKLVVERQAGQTGTQGIGISEWEVYQVYEEKPEPIELPFEDVTEDDWFYEAVYFNFVEGYMSGKSATIFAPETVLTRAEFASVLYSANDTPAVTYEAKFSDIAEEDWYAPAVIWASKEGIVNGYGNNLFGPTDPVAREQMAIMMYNYAAAKGYDTDQRADLSTFKDGTDVSWYAEEAMQWAVGAGIITGKDGGTRLDAYGATSRAECAAIIQKFMEKCAK